MRKKKDGGLPAHYMDNKKITPVDVVYGTHTVGASTTFNPEKLFEIAELALQRITISHDGQITIQHKTPIQSNKTT